MSKPFSDQAAVAGIELDEEIIRFANLVRNAALEEAAKTVDSLYRPGGGTYADSILELKQRIK